MLTGLLPWTENNSIVDLYKSIKNKKVEFPKSVKVHDEIKTIIVHMLAVQEEKRWNVVEVCDALEKVKL